MVWGRYIIFGYLDPQGVDAANYLKDSMTSKGYIVHIPLWVHGPKCVAHWVHQEGGDLPKPSNIVSFGVPDGC